MSGPLEGKVALVSGATRGGGRGIAVALGEAGATVYATGRSTREQRSEIDRPETIEETAELVTAAGGEGIAVAVDHLDPAQVAGLVERIDSEHGRLDVLVNDIWGSEHLFEWKSALWEHDLDNGLRLLRLAIDTHLITSHHALPLLVRQPGGLVVEVTDGTAAYNADHYRIGMFYDLAKTSVTRMAWGLAKELAPHGGTAVALTPGWMRSELMLEHHGVSESNWREATERTPHFCISESPRSSAGRWPRWPAIPRCRAGTGSHCRAAGSRRSTASPTRTEPGPTAGATWSRWSSARARPPATTATADARTSAPAPRPARESSAP